MPEYRDDSPRKRPRGWSRSSSPIKKHKSRGSPHQLTYNEIDRRDGRMKPRDSLDDSPPQQRHRSRDPEDDYRRRTERERSLDREPLGPRHRNEAGDFRKYSSRHHSKSRSPTSKDRRRLSSRSPPSRHRRHISNSRDSQHRRHSSHNHGRTRDHEQSPYHNEQTTPSHKPASVKRTKAPLPSQEAAYTQNSEFSNDAIVKPDPKAEKEKPNYAPSGLLAAETNTVANTNIVLKYNEPPESRLPPPSQPWRLYVFKNKDLLDTIPLHTRPCWLFGREKAVCDVAVEHPSASKQHAVLQFRYLEKSFGEFGQKKGKVGLYVLDLESANGTKLNGEVLPGRRFVECRSGDMIQFGESIREYVALLPPKD